MMKENFAKLRAREAEYEAKAARLAAELEAKEGAQAGLDAEALRGEVLGESGWKEARTAADRNREAVRLTREELGRAKQGIEILRGEKGKIMAGVVDEIRAEYRGKFAKALKDVCSKLRAAEAAKIELRQIRDAADREAGAYEISSQMIQLQPTGAPVFLERDFLDEFVTRSKMNGYDVE